MRCQIPFACLALAASASCLEVGLRLDHDTVAYPDWISGTLEARNTGSGAVVLSMEESRPGFRFLQDTAQQLANVTDFGPASPTTLAPGASAQWCFMAEVPEAFARSRAKGAHTATLSMRAFGAEAKPVPITLRLGGPLSDEERSLAKMDLARRLGRDELVALGIAAKRLAFTGKPRGKVDPRIVFWKYRLRQAANMPDLKRMPICDACFALPASPYWANLQSDWCRMFYWETPRCAENREGLRELLVSRIGKPAQLPGAVAGNTPVRTAKGIYVLSQSQIKLLAEGGPRK